MDPVQKDALRALLALEKDKPNVKFAIRMLERIVTEDY